MKELKDYKEIIHKCSKCGLCQSVCPAYLETGNECTVSRGQFIMLQGIIKGDLKMNKTINKYLDLCLKCGKCSDFCPSDIDIVEVILSAKAEYFKTSFEGKILSILQSKTVFNTALNITRFIFNCGRKKINPPSFTPAKKAVYFGGCIETVFPNTSDYIKTLLNKMNIEVIDINFNCCGLPFLTSGNIERFNEQMEENLKKIKDLDFDYFITDCSSCEWAWKQYGLDESKFKSIYDLINENNLEFESKKHCTITYHEPCHGGAEDIINRIHNIDYKELEGKNDCCGFAGLIKPSTWKITKKIIFKKKQNIQKTNADFILTSCVGCLITLGLITGFKYKIRRLISFLEKHCRVL